MKKCNFCKKIYTIKEAKEWQNDYSYYFFDNIDYNIIVKRNNDFELWNRYDDNYYTGCVMTIKYCPKCGRKLADAGTRSRDL